MKLFRTPQGNIVEHAGQHYSLAAHSWDALIARDDVQAFLRGQLECLPKCGAPVHLLPPVVSQEIWASGVTYMRSREARKEESKVGGGGDFYDRVYAAERP